MTTCEYSHEETNYGEFEQRWIYSRSSSDSSTNNDLGRSNFISNWHNYANYSVISSFLENDVL